jgi:hypothetical protein
MLRIEAKHTDIILAVQHNELIRTELNGSYRASSRSLERYADSFLTEYVDNAGPELGFVRADSKEGLHGIVRED